MYDRERYPLGADVIAGLLHMHCKKALEVIMYQYLKEYCVIENMQRVIFNYTIFKDGFNYTQKHCVIMTWMYVVVVFFFVFFVVFF